MHHDRRLRHAQPGAAHIFRHGDAQPTAFGHRLIVFLREVQVGLAIRPVLVAETRTNLAHAFVDRDLLFGELEVHGIPLFGSFAQRTSRARAYGH